MNKVELDTCLLEEPKILLRQDSPQSGNRVSYIEISSGEQIPDEYSHKDNGNFRTELFYSRNQKENRDYLVQELLSLGFKVNEHPFQNKEKFLKDLKNCETENDTTGLLVIVLSDHKEENSLSGILWPDQEELFDGGIEIKDVWVEFLPRKYLFGKPKVFLIHTYSMQSSVQTDNMDDNLKTNYSLNMPPPEADFLLVYHATKEPKNTFMRDLCQKIKDEADKFTLIDLVSFTDKKNNKDTLMVSTLTRKLFLKHSDYRGPFLEMIDASSSLHQNHCTRIETVETMSSQPYFETRNVQTDSFLYKENDCNELEVNGNNDEKIIHDTIENESHEPNENSGLMIKAIVFLVLLLILTYIVKN